MDPLEEPSIYPRSSAYILDPGEYKPLTTGNVKIEMTKGVTTKHILEKKDKYGEIELQEMCFYLENKFQVISLRKFMKSILITRILFRRPWVTVKLCLCQLTPRLFSVQN